MWTGYKRERIGVGILIRGPEGIIMEYALRFSFKATNNEVEYEAMITGLLLVKGLGMDQVLYHTKALSAANEFTQAIFEHIPKEANGEGDHLSQLVTTYYDELPQGVYVKIRERPAYEVDVAKPVLEEPKD
ncbi:hypothetical protein LIER_23238 [Lithospermum erythrorhizon]|uniref:Reverse transcriptase domain-containing protein n=1 Tax=Lithospermum erythrorhizon TaxID=34254 RepID=A0AAV3QWP1_LITER